MAAANPTQSGVMGAWAVQQPMRPQQSPAHTADALLATSTHGAFVAHMTSLPNLQGIQRLAMQWIAARVSPNGKTDEPYVHAPPMEGVRAAVLRVLSQRPAAPFTRAEVVAANRLAVKAVAQDLQTRRSQLRMMRLIASAAAPYTDTAAGKPHLGAVQSATVLADARRGLAARAKAGRPARHQVPLEGRYTSRPLAVKDPWASRRVTLPSATRKS